MYDQSDVGHVDSHSQCIGGYYPTGLAFLAGPLLLNASGLVLGISNPTPIRGTSQCLRDPPHLLDGTAVYDYLASFVCGGPRTNNLAYTLYDGLIILPLFLPLLVDGMTYPICPPPLAGIHWVAVAVAVAALLVFDDIYPVLDVPSRRRLSEHANPAWDEPQLGEQCLLLRWLQRGRQTYHGQPEFL
ncbi:Fc.00g073150.m01.CDS01 [Cosmosporella sp. VM-42]